LQSKTFKNLSDPFENELRSPKADICCNQDDHAAATTTATAATATTKTGSAPARLAAAHVGRRAAEFGPAEEARRRRLAPAPPAPGLALPRPRGGARQSRDVEPARRALFPRIAARVSHCARSLWNAVMSFQRNRQSPAPAGRSHRRESAVEGHAWIGRENGQSAQSGNEEERARLFGPLLQPRFEDAERSRARDELRDE